MAINYADYVINRLRKSRGRVFGWCEGETSARENSRKCSGILPRM